MSWKSSRKRCHSSGKNSHTQIQAARIPDRHNLEKTLSEKLQRLIFFCHPDKHGNAQEATERTQWLLNLREWVRSC